MRCRIAVAVLLAFCLHTENPDLNKRLFQRRRRGPVPGLARLPAPGRAQARWTAALSLRSRPWRRGPRPQRQSRHHRVKGTRSQPHSALPDRRRVPALHRRINRRHLRAARRSHSAVVRLPLPAYRSRQQRRRKPAGFGSGHLRARAGTARRSQTCRIGHSLRMMTRSGSVHVRIEATQTPPSDGRPSHRPLIGHLKNLGCFNITLNQSLTDDPCWVPVDGFIVLYLSD